MTAGATQTLAQILFSQGFGTRRHCAASIADGQVQVDGVTLDDPHAALPTDGLVLSVRGQSWPYHAKALVLLHKPADYECSAKPRHHPSILSLLPAPLRERGVQAVGRLDADTTGMLLLTDDGALIHRLTSPKHHVHKVYEVRGKHALAADAVARLLSGVVLDDDPEPVGALACVATGDSSLRLTLTEGRYTRSSAWWLPSVTASKRCTAVRWVAWRSMPRWRRGSGAGSTRPTANGCSRAPDLKPRPHRDNPRPCKSFAARSTPASPQPAR